MRIRAWAILTIATVLTAAPALAQMYNPDYPVCLQTYGIDGGYIGCGYTSLAQRPVGRGPRRPVHHQSLFCGRASACATT